MYSIEISNLTKRTLNATAVHISVMKVATMINLPIFSLNNPFSAKTLYTTAILVSDNAVAVSKLGFKPQPIILYVKTSE